MKILKKKIIRKLYICTAKFIARYYIGRLIFVYKKRNKRPSILRTSVIKFRVLNITSVFM